MNVLTTNEYNKLEKKFKAPKTELKSIKHHEGREGQGVRCNLFINGLKCIEAYMMVMAVV